VIRIEKAARDDRDTVLGLVEKLLRELEDSPDEFAGLEPGRVARDLEAAGDRFTAFLARSDSGEAVGIATLFESFAIYAGGSYGIIDEMYVDPAWRGAGVGRSLLQAVAEHGRRRGWVRIDVTAPPEKRWERTVRFYEREGFVFTGPKLRLMLARER